METMEDVLHAGSGLGADLDDLHSGSHTLDIATSGSDIEIGSLGQIHLGDNRDIGTVEDGLRAAGVPCRLDRQITNQCSYSELRG